uniref:Probable pectate lyase F n=1 Tax=Ditylenchus dipsaci TaxID=166011 RepID=A0A915D2T7_9BILA
MFYCISLFTVIAFSLVQTGLCDFWPDATGNITVNATVFVDAGQTFDCNLTRFIPNPKLLGDGSQKERQKAVFVLRDEATLKNCIIGAAPGTEGSADGVHCMGAGCTVDNVWFENVGEDAITLYGINSSDIVYNIQNCGARDSSDKIIQFDGKGTANIKNFWADTFARFMRSCGKCPNQYERHIVLNNITAYNGEAGQFIVGVNTNYNDSATITGLTLGGASAHKVWPCKRFKGSIKSEPVSDKNPGPDDKYCIYDPNDVTYVLR